MYPLMAIRLQKGKPVLSHLISTNDFHVMTINFHDHSCPRFRPFINPSMTARKPLYVRSCEGVSASQTTD